MMEILLILGLPLAILAAYVVIYRMMDSNLCALLGSLAAGALLASAGAGLKIHTTDAGLMGLLINGGCLSWVVIGYALAVGTIVALVMCLDMDDDSQRWEYIAIFVAMLALGWFCRDLINGNDWTELPLSLLGIEWTVLLVAWGLSTLKNNLGGWRRFLVSTATFLLVCVLLAWIFYDETTAVGLTQTEHIVFNIALAAFLIEFAVGAIAAVSGISTYIVSLFSAQVKVKTKKLRSYCSRILGSCLIFAIPTCILLGYFFFISMFIPSKSTPFDVEFHNAHDLQKATNVEFPAVTPVDSSYEDDFIRGYTTVKFVPDRPLTKKFYRRLERACKEDPCWEKNTYGVDGYSYIIYIDVPEGGFGAFDRTKGMTRKMYDMDGDGKKETPYWQGNYINVTVPMKGDTITVEYGWMN